MNRLHFFFKVVKFNKNRLIPCGRRAEHRPTRIFEFRNSKIPNSLIPCGRKAEHRPTPKIIKKLKTAASLAGVDRNTDLQPRIGRGEDGATPSSTTC